jgi:hypothetical protein
VEVLTVRFDGLLKVDEVAEAAMRERDALCLLLALDFFLLGRERKFLLRRSRVGRAEVRGAVDDRVEELGE